MWRQCVCHICIIIAILVTGCSREETVTIDTSKTEKTKTPEFRQRDHIRVALGGMITPKEGLAYYKEFLDYIGVRLGRSVDYVDAEDYAEINKKLKNGELEAAFVCSGPYVDGKKEFGLEFIAAPQVAGEAVYYSYIIVPAASHIYKLEDLRKKSFAFADPLSNSGKIVPEYILSRQGETSSRFFEKTSYSGSHDNSIKAVSQGVVDGAAVDSLIYEYKRLTDPDMIAKTRIIFRSEPYAPPPFVVRAGLDPALKEKLRSIILNAHTTPEGKAILQKMLIDRFVVLDDKAYDSVRTLKTWLAKSSDNSKH